MKFCPAGTHDALEGDWKDVRRGLAQDQTNRDGICAVGTSSMEGERDGLLGWKGPGNKNWQLRRTNWGTREQEGERDFFGFSLGTHSLQNTLCVHLLVSGDQQLHEGWVL